VAKVSKVNVAITGDSSGLAKATDSAAANLRRLRAEGEATRKRLGEMKGTTNQAAEALAKFGVSNKGLGMASGVLGLGSMGAGGIAIAGVGAILAGVSAVVSAYQDLSTEAEAARKAQESALGFRAAGFTEAGGRALAAMPVEPKAIGFGRGLTQTLAIQQQAQGGKRSNFQNIVEYAPGALGAILGGYAAGGIVEGKDIAAAIGDVEQKRLNESIHEVAPFYSSVIDLTFDVINLLRGNAAK
jgi:hypothetical protein